MSCNSEWPSMTYYLSDLVRLLQGYNVFSRYRLLHVSSYLFDLNHFFSPSSHIIQEDNRPTAEDFSFIPHTACGGPNQNVNIWLHCNSQTVLFPKLPCMLNNTLSKTPMQFCQYPKSFQLRYREVFTIFNTLKHQ